MVGSQCIILLLFILTTALVKVDTDKCELEEYLLFNKIIGYYSERDRWPIEMRGCVGRGRGP